MISVQKGVSLLPYNTFGQDVQAEAFVVLEDEADLAEITVEYPIEKKVLGGGSNVLLTKPVEGLVILNKLSGISVLKEDAAHVWINVKGGQNWHELVMYTVEKGLGGIENLALIPGSVGASPIQNIGAYGREVRETIESVTAWHWYDQKFITLNNRDCQFGYRDSIFKRELKDKVIVTSVVFRLDKQPILRTSYGAIAEELSLLNETPTVASVAAAVIRIRQSKLPDPKVLGNAGSFFKNPTIPITQYELLHDQFPELPSYPVGDAEMKVPAGWLIEQCGLKGKRIGAAGVHAKQALVLVNYGGATGEDILHLSQNVIDTVNGKFGIMLEREVQIW